MKKVEYWYFKIEYTKGKVEIGCYGNSEEYTQKEAEKKMKALCKQRGWKYIGIHKD